MKKQLRTKNNQEMKAMQNITPRQPKNLDSINNVAVRTHFANKTIGRLGPDEITKPLQAVILITAQRLGIKIGAVEVQDICRFTVQYFKGLAIEEIPLAFELLSAQKFETKASGHFGLLSLTYWGDVLTSYQRYRMEETRKENIKIESSEKELTKNEIETKNLRAMFDGVIQSWTNYKDKNTMQHEPGMDLISHFYYDYLRSQNIMERPSNEETEIIKAEAETYMKNEIKLRRINANKTELKSLSEQIGNVHNSPTFVNICKKIALRVYFENLVLAETDLEKLLTKTTTK